MVSIRYFCGVGELTWLKSRPRGCFTSNREEVAGSEMPMAANASRKSRRVIRRFIRCFVGSRGAIARLAEVARGRMPGREPLGGASTVVVMASGCAAKSKQRDCNCRSRLHERFAEDVFWKLEERKVDAGGRHPPSFHSRARTGTSKQTESTLGCLIGC
jgi:hypothetical protein